MNPEDPVSVRIGKHPLDDTLVRTTVEEVKQSARRARHYEVALVVATCFLMVMVAAFTGYNTYRLRSVNKNLTALVEAIEANQETQQTYNEAHALSAGENFNALLENIRCFTDFFVAFNEAVAAAAPPPAKADLDACFKPSTPPPPPADLPSEDEEEKP